ncbi:hypothetical protein [Mycolicibacterium austroafricanum]|uniref:hypothetical protein n=1 Tax=Mycolicibacterium austroafricanum TaxID=39687 RepID=UPI001CA38402|nr:hypothetical protein [Mycolicibacterium austroafricanum]QZT54997.1 hypothetical protein JN084_18480 [Mycolicibacterium austroafricanum]
MNDELSQANNRGFELGRRHAALADVILQAAVWARSFGVSTAEVLPDGSVFMAYPLTQHADYLMKLWRLLGGACVDLASSFEGRMSAQDVSVTPLSHGAAIRSTTYVTGADYVHALQSRTAHGSTLQDLWRNEVTNAALYLSVCGIRTDELERYASISQALFDDASTVVRDAYAHSVAVTYGRIWARASQANEGRALIAWMKALADGGFSFEECVLELRDLKVASPEAVSCCLNSKSAWLHEE